MSRPGAGQPALKILSNVIGNQVRQHFLKVFMKHGAGGSKRATEILKVTVPNTWPSKKKSLQPGPRAKAGRSPNTAMVSKQVVSRIPKERAKLALRL